MSLLRPALAVTTILGCGLFLGGCSRTESAESGGSAALMRNLLRARTVEIVVRPGPIESACWKAAERIARERHVECRVLSPAQHGDPRAVRILVAGPESELGASLARRMGLNPITNAERSSFGWRGMVFTDPADAFFAVLEDPERPGLPLTLLYGNDESRLEPYVESLEPCWRPSLRVYRKLDPRIEAPLSVSGTIDESRLVSWTLLRWTALRGFEDLPVRDDGISGKCSPRIDRAIRDAYLASVARSRNATAAWADSAREREPVTMILHDRPEALATCVGGVSLSGWNPITNEIHALVAPDVPDDAGLEAARALAQGILGPPSAAWLDDGAAIFAAHRYFGRDLDEWVAWLRSAELAPPVAALIDPQAAETNSPHLVLPLRAALFHHLLENRGEAFLRSVWIGTSKLEVDAELEGSFGTWLDEKASRRHTALEARHLERRGAWLEDPFLAGVGIEEPGPAPELGFGSRAFLQSLEEARAIGAGAVALTCFVTAERAPTALPSVGPHARGERAFGPTCGDLRLFAAMCQARAKGMKTLLQPRLLTAPGGSLAGTGPQIGEKGWQRFFDGYARFARHFALLAELAQADGISLGGGMTASTGSSSGGRRSVAEEVTWRRTGWEAVVGSVRGAFSGSLTWTADSDVDARELSFWDLLDFVSCDMGVDLDARSSRWQAAPPVQAEAEIGAQMALFDELAAVHGKPWMLTQASFRSGAPESASRRSGRIVGSDGWQAMQFGALGGALAKAKKRGNLRGVILWRWSTDPSDGGVNPRDGLLRPGPAREAAARVLAGR